MDEMAIEESNYLSLKVSRLAEFFSEARVFSPWSVIAEAKGRDI